MKQFIQVPVHVGQGLTEEIVINTDGINMFEPYEYFDNKHVARQGTLIYLDCGKKVIAYLTFTQFIAKYNFFNCER